MASLLPSPQNPNEVDTVSHLKTSTFLSREEVLRRRSRQAKALYKFYRDQYWELVEEIRAKHREYYWDLGLSPLEKENRSDEGNGVKVEGLGEEGKIRVRSKCGFGGCKSKAMPFTRFCHLHILADPKQTLYKGCIFVTKSSGQNGPCGKPILRAAVPSLCHAHFGKFQKNLSQSMKKLGVNLSSSSRSTTQLNAILTECVHKIQADRKKVSTKRSTASNATANNKLDEKKNVL